MSYDPELLEEPLHYARFLLADTSNDPKTEALQDAEIRFMIDAHGFNEGVAQCAEAILGKFSYEPDKQSDNAGLNSEWKERGKTLRDLAARMRAGIVKTSALPIDTSPGTKTGVISHPDTSGLRLPNW